MRYPRSNIDIEKARSWLNYDPLTGQLKLKKPTARCAVGHVFTSKYPQNYVLCSYGGYRNAAHRVIWAMVTGEQPDTIDHRNGVKSDNRWINLRNGTQQENTQNRREHRRARGEPGPHD